MCVCDLLKTFISAGVQIIAVEGIVVRSASGGSDCFLSVPDLAWVAFVRLFVSRAGISQLAVVLFWKGGVFDLWWGVVAVMCVAY